MYNFDDVYQYSIFIANVQSTAIVDFYLVYDGSVDMKICPLLTRSQCRVSDTHQATVKARGPLVHSLIGLLICKYELF